MPAHAEWKSLRLLPLVPWPVMLRSSDDGYQAANHGPNDPWLEVGRRCRQLLAIPCYDQRLMRQLTIERIYKGAPVEHANAFQLLDCEVKALDFTGHLQYPESYKPWCSRADQQRLTKRLTATGSIRVVIFSGPFARYQQS